LKYYTDYPSGKNTKKFKITERKKDSMKNEKKGENFSYCWSICKHIDLGCLKEIFANIYDLVSSTLVQASL